MKKNRFMFCFIISVEKKYVEGIIDSPCKDYNQY